MLDSYLATLCEELGAAPIRFDEMGEAHVAGAYDGREVTVSFVLREQFQVLMMRAAVVELVEDSAAESAQALLLGLNLSPADLLGAAFALSPADATVYLVSTLVGPELTYASFRVAFLRLFSLTSIWRAQLTSSPAFAPPKGI